MSAAGISRSIPVTTKKRTNIGTSIQTVNIDTKQSIGSGLNSNPNGLTGNNRLGQYESETDGYAPLSSIGGVTALDTVSNQKQRLGLRNLNNKTYIPKFDGSKILDSSYYPKETDGRKYERQHEFP